MLNKLSSILNKIDSSNFKKLYQNLECLSITASSSYTTSDDIIKALFVIAFDKKPSMHYTFSKNIQKQASVQNSLNILQKFLLYKKAVSFIKSDTSLYNPETPEGLPDFVNFPKYVEKYNRNPEKNEIEEIAETKEFGKVAKALGKYFIINPISGNVTKLFLNAKGLELINKKADKESLAVVEQLIEEGASDYKDFLQQAIVDYAQNGSNSAKFREQIIVLVPSYLKNQTSLSDEDWEELGEWLVENSHLAKEEESNDFSNIQSSYYDVIPKGNRFEVYEDGKLTATLDSLADALTLPYKSKPLEVDAIKLELQDGSKVDMTNRAKKIGDGQPNLQLNAADNSEDTFNVKEETEGMQEIETPEDKFKHFEEEKEETFSASDLSENLAYIKQNSPEEYEETKEFLKQNLVGEDQKAYDFIETLEDTNFQFTEATEKSGLYDGHSQYQDLLQNKVLPLLKELPAYQDALTNRVDPDKEK